MEQKQLTECSVCRNNELGYLKGYQKLFLLKCDECSFIFDQRVPSFKELDDHYNLSSYLGLKPISEATVNSMNKLLDYFEEFRIEGNILDIGCGQGDFLVEARKRNWNVYGSEYSNSAMALCEERGINMYQGDLEEDMFEGIKFDVITSFEVLEHIQNPNDLMSIMKHKLRDQGLGYHTTPNFNSLLRFFERDRFKMIEYPAHISFYSRSSIRYLGEINNFKSMKIETTGLDISRLVDVFKLLGKGNVTEPNEPPYEREDITENVRQAIASNGIFGSVKNISNYVLSIFGIGDTLKVFWIKN